jgi:molybdopterin-guanine dinucleotide biosynthesis protein A
MTGIILAGGKGRRILSEKTLIEIGGKKIIDRIIDLFCRLFDEIIVVTNSPDRYASSGVTITPDVILGKGPLVGIYSGLLSSTQLYNFVVGCDMPFIQSELVEYMGALTEDYDLIVPEVNGYYEPLHAIYSKNCIDKIRRLIEKKTFKIQELFEKVKLRPITKDEIIRYDPRLISFTNINTKEDLIRAKEMAGATLQESSPFSLPS